MKVLINDRIKIVIERYLSENNFNHITAPSADFSSLATPSQEELCQRLQEELVTGFLSTNSYKFLVNYNQSLGLEPFFSSIQDVKVKGEECKSNVQEKEESAEKVKRREYLKVKQEEREYRAMLDNSIYGNSDDSNSNVFNSLKFQVTMGFNMIAAIGASFGIGYYISIQMNFSSSKSMIIGLSASILMMIVEMVLFISRAVRAEEVNENKKKSN